MMDSQDSKTPAHGNAQDGHRHLPSMPALGRHDGETYAEHLSRVTQDADYARALLQAHYRALHAVAAMVPGPAPNRDD